MQAMGNKINEQKSLWLTWGFVGIFASVILIFFVAPFFVQSLYWHFYFNAFLYPICSRRFSFSSFPRNFIMHAVSFFGYVEYSAKLFLLYDHWSWLLLSILVFFDYYYCTKSF